MGQVITQTAAAIAATPHTTALVEATSALVVPANPERDRVVISVPTGDQVWLGYGAAAVEGEGIVVNGGGTPYEITSWKGDIYMLSATAINVAWMELEYNAGDTADGNELDAGASTFVPSGPSDGHPSTDAPTFEQLATPIVSGV